MFDGWCWVHFTDDGEYDGVACSDDKVAAPPEDFTFPLSSATIELPGWLRNQFVHITQQINSGRYQGRAATPVERYCGEIADRAIETIDNETRKDRT